MNDPAQGRFDGFGDRPEPGAADILDPFANESPFADTPHPVDWEALSAAERRAELTRLHQWVVDLVAIWPVDRSVVPPCWYRHETLIRILAACRDAYLTAYDPSQAASAAADWMHVWDATQERLRRWVLVSGCRSGQHRADPLQRWAHDARNGAASPDSEFEQFVRSDFEAARGREAARASR
ncbi:MAG: hypothetical protein ACRD0W_08385 [Acidimicrobiales bacterium]